MVSNRRNLECRLTRCAVPSNTFASIAVLVLVLALACNRVGAATIDPTSVVSSASANLTYNSARVNPIFPSPPLDYGAESSVVSGNTPNTWQSATVQRDGYTAVVPDPIFGLFPIPWVFGDASVTTVAPLVCG